MIVRISGNKSKRDEVDRLFFFSRTHDYSVLFRVLFLFSSSLYSYINVHGKSRANIARVLWKSTAHYVVFLSSSFNWWRNQQRNDNRTRFPPHVPAGCQHTVSPLCVYFSPTLDVCVIRVYFTGSVCICTQLVSMQRDVWAAERCCVPCTLCVLCTWYMLCACVSKLSIHNSYSAAFRMVFVFLRFCFHSVELKPLTRLDIFCICYLRAYNKTFFFVKHRRSKKKL